MSEPLAKLSLRQAINLTKQAIREKGWDYIYPDWEENCINFRENGMPSCVVGHVLNYAGVTLAGLKVKDLEWREAHGNDCSYNQCSIISLSHDVVELDEQAEIFLSKFQVEQDQGKTWGQSYVLALQELYQWRKSVKEDE